MAYKAKVATRIGWLFAVTMACLALTGCGLFGSSTDIDTTSGEETGEETSDGNESTGDDGGDDNGGDESTGDEQSADNNESFAEVAEEDALAIIRAAAVDNGVAPEQRAGTTGSFTVQFCGDQASANDRDIESIPGTHLMFCVQSEDDYWQFHLRDSAGNLVAEEWSTFGSFEWFYSLLQPVDVYTLTATARSGGVVTAEYDVGNLTRLALESTTLDGQPALAIGGYGDKSQLILAAYDASSANATISRSSASPVLNVEQAMPHLTDLGPIALDPSGRTVVPIVDSDVESYCVFTAEDFSQTFACFGVGKAQQLASLAPGVGNTIELVKALQVKTGRDDVWIEAPVEYVLKDQSVLTAATVTELKSGRPLGAAGFVTGGGVGKPELQLLVQDDDFAAAFAGVCKEFETTFELAGDPCNPLPPIIIYFDPTLVLETPVVRQPLDTVVDLELYELLVPLNPSLYINPGLLDPALLDPALLNPTPDEDPDG